MRIVSSDGSIDIPYESVALFAHSDGSVAYSFYGDSEFSLRLSYKYKNSDRALKVMSDIRYAYVMGRKMFVMPKE